MPILRQSSRTSRLCLFRHRSLLAFSFFVLFWSLFDGIISYITPLLITERGFSETALGLIIGSSSVAGALFDFLICKIFTDTRYQRLCLMLFAICFFYPLLLGSAQTIWLFLLAMALWGLYYNLMNFATFDFVSHHASEETRVSSFGTIYAFKSLGYTLAPLLAGLVIGLTIGWKPLGLAWIFLAIGLFLYLGLQAFVRRRRFSKEKQLLARKLNALAELNLWRRLGKRLLPVLLLTTLITVCDSFFWTIGPLMAARFTELGRLEGVLLMSYNIPALFIGWFAGKITRKIGKKNTAFLSFLAASIILSLFIFLHNPYVIIGAVFVTAFFVSLSWPSIDGAYVDYISEAPKIEKEIQGLSDFFVNIGYVIGPILAGLLADRFSETGAFSILGLFGLVSVLLLKRITPKHISVKKV